jgi:hypothetical protein
MSKIVNTTRGLVRPTRDPDSGAESADVPVTDANLSHVQGRLQQRPLGPVAPRRDVEDRSGDAPQYDDTSTPLADTIGLTADIPIGHITRIAVKSPVSSMTVTQLMGALELHGRRTSISHDGALAVLARLKMLLDHITERRSWSGVPRVRRRVQRKRRDA